MQLRAVSVLLTRQCVNLVLCIRIGASGLEHLTRTFLFFLPNKPVERDAIRGSRIFNKNRNYISLPDLSLCKPRLQAEKATLLRRPVEGMEGEPARFRVIVKRDTDLALPEAGINRRIS